MQKRRKCSANLKREEEKKLCLPRSGVTTCWKRCDNNGIKGTLGFCHRWEVVSDEV